MEKKLAETTEDTKEEKEEGEGKGKGLGKKTKGIMLHWGIYSVPAFNPVRTNKKGIYNGRFVLFSFIIFCFLLFQLCCFFSFPYYSS